MPNFFTWRNDTQAGVNILYGQLKLQTLNQAFVSKEVSLKLISYECSSTQIKTNQRKDYSYRVGDKPLTVPIEQFVPDGDCNYTHITYTRQIFDPKGDLYTGTLFEFTAADLPETQGTLSVFSDQEDILAGDWTLKIEALIQDVRQGGRALGTA